MMPVCVSIILEWVSKVYSVCVFYPLSSLYSSNIWQEAYGGCLPLNTFKLAWRAATVVSCCGTHTNTHTRQIWYVNQIVRTNITFGVLVVTVLLLLTISPLTASSISVALLTLARPSWKDSSLFHSAVNLKDRQRYLCPHFILNEGWRYYVFFISCQQIPSKN